MKNFFIIEQEDFGMKIKHSKEDFYAEFKNNHFFENKLILKRMLTYIDGLQLQQLLDPFKNIREHESEINYTLGKRYFFDEKSGFKKHRNCSNQVHSCFCYIELLDARSILFNDVRIPNLETLQKLV